MCRTIKRIHCNMMDCEVGKDGVKNIEPSTQGSPKNTMYKLTLDDGDVLFIGMLEHEIEYGETEVQSDIFDYL